MATLSLDERITSLEAVIAGYEEDLKNSTTEARKDILYGLIKTRSETLNKLLDQKAAGKFVMYWFYLFCFV